METRQQQVRESIEAFNRADWPALRALTAPDISYDETVTGRRMGGDAIVHERHHLDVGSMMAQLGVLPAPASA